MKKFILLLAAVTTISSIYAQDKQESKKFKNNLSASVLISDPSGFGINYEYGFKNEKDKYTSYLFSLSSSTSTLTLFNKEITGSGFIIATGNRNYFKEFSKWYVDNQLIHSQTNFIENGFKGKYTYWSLFNPEIGYKFIIAKSFTIEAGAGFIWKWEVNTKTDLDNKDFDNLVAKVTLKAGYRF